jgi:cyclic pyranopterin phosphate synthase
MPEEGIRLTGREKILQESEIIRVCQVMAELGIKKIKITGGEPLVRPRIPGLIRQIKAIPGIEKVTLTTNGILLKKQMKELAEAGLDSLNISLDTLDREGFIKITRRDFLDDTLAGIEEAMKYPNVQLKINCVPLGIEEQNLCEIAEFARKYPVHVRFIEMMPIGYGSSFTGMSQEKIVSLLEEKFGRLVPYEGEPLGNGPCKYYTVDGFQGKIGFISAISHKFCSECNRIRLTSQGYLKTCLQYTAGRDLREALRNGGTDEKLKEIIKAALSEKPDGHHFREKVKEDDTESLCMSQIGG